MGVEPPKWHDVSPILRREIDRFPEWFREYLDELVSISRSLRKERELAMYGDEEAGIPPGSYILELMERKLLHMRRKF